MRLIAILMVSIGLIACGARKGVPRSWKYASGTTTSTSCNRTEGRRFTDLTGQVVESGKRESRPARLTISTFFESECIWTMAYWRGVAT